MILNSDMDELAEFFGVVAVQFDWMWSFQQIL